VSKLTEHNRDRVLKTLKDSRELLNDYIAEEMPREAAAAELYDRINKAIAIVCAIDTVTDEPRAFHFSWGPIVATHRVGKYLIVEFKERRGDGIMFHPFIEQEDGSHKDTSMSFPSMDGALLGAIAYVRDERSAIPYVARLLRIDPVTGRIIEK
jgi:hypothetical protein